MKLTPLPRRVATLDITHGSDPVRRIVGRQLQRIRDRVLLDEAYTCRGCGRASSTLEVDHIIPLHLGGVETDANRQALCPQCHREKTRREELGRFALRR